ncbi:DUF2513 domain-containing protein [Bacillus toyonensis]|uniref:DUF2513 domain-containing protein n=1 Tax=Bacillus toyonensis TaxID=155322 RepID=UPI0038233467
MKRDMELVRNILIQIEENNPRTVVKLIMEENDKFTEDEIDYHLKLMVDAGLIDGQAKRVMGGGLLVNIRGLTWLGHDFLDAARNDKVWEKANETAESKGLDLRSLPLEVVKDFLVESAKALIGF